MSVPKIPARQGKPFGDARLTASWLFCRAEIPPESVFTARQNSNIAPVRRDF
jgi:hypothetical protein